MEDMIFNKHYIAVREDNCIIDGFSDAFRQPSENDICINEQGSYHFRLFPNGEENPCLFYGFTAIPLYKYENGEVIKRTDAEIEAEKEALPPPEPIDSELQWQAITDLEIAQMEYEQALTDLEIAQLEG